jgi:hypothetical protein
MKQNQRKKGVVLQMINFVTREATEATLHCYLHANFNSKITCKIQYRVAFVALGGILI